MWNRLTQEIKLRTARKEEKNMNELELEILKLSGLELSKELHVYDVPFIYEDQECFLHTYRCGDENPETLILLHGYGGSSLLFFGMLKELSKKYRVFCVDLLGMGLSSRKGFKCQTPEDTIEYFVESFERWREAVGLEEFLLGGHSFGAYMATHYTLRYQSRVKKLFLLSPAGVTQPQTEVSADEWSKQIPLVRRAIYHLIINCWENQTTPHDFYVKNTWIASIVLRRYMTIQFGNNGKDLKLVDLLLEFYLGILKRVGGSDKAILLILKPPRAIAVKPLEEDIAKGIEVPIVCYYGDRDWMDKTGAHRIKQVKKGFKLKQIDNSGHQLTMHNPQQLAEDILMEGVA